MLLVVALAVAGAKADVIWTAYNDCHWEPETDSKATRWTIHNGDLLFHSEGRLNNFATDSNDGMPWVDFTMGDEGLGVSSDSAGGAPAPGTPAYEIFYDDEDEIVNFDGSVVYYGAPGWWVEIEFTGLDPTKTYSFVGTAIRSSDPDDYSDRITRFTISVADSFTWNSSPGVGGSGATAELKAGDNRSTGYVVRWDDIVPGLVAGPDYSFKVRAEAHPDFNYKAYPFGGFMLQELGEPGNQPPVVNAGSDRQTMLPINYVELNGTVEDDGLGEPNGFLKITWSKDSGPGVVTFEPNEFVEDPNARFSAAGEYVLKLSAWDGELDANDVVTITVLEPACPIGDLNNDCIVDFKDVLIFVGPWMTDPVHSGFGHPDLDGSDRVDMGDYGLLSQNWFEEWLGSLQVTISPQGAINAGAKWQVDGGSWRDSGEPADDLPAGLHTVDFKPVAGWTRPGSQDVEVIKWQTTGASSQYVELPDSNMVISEFMAINSYVPLYNPLNLYTIVEGQVEHPDWVEIHNIGTEIEELDGWYLTDNKNNLTKWQFPDGYSIGVGGYFVVYASNKDFARFPGNYPYEDDSGNFHTNFELDGDGEYLALVKPDGVTVAYEYPKYPEQRGLISYGIAPDGEVGYLKLVKRGEANSDIYDGVVADTTFTVDRGFYDDPFDVIIDTPTPGATIHYTIDGSTPTETHGDEYTTPIHIISETICLRAVAFKADWLTTNVDTQTYIFLDDVLEQATNPGTGAQVTPAGCPEKWESGPGDPSYENWTSTLPYHAGDYQVDPEVVSAYSSTIKDDLKAVPTLSLTMNIDDWFGPEGIYVHEGLDGEERACSAEFFDANGQEEFQINCGVRMQGGVSGGGTSLRRWKSYKCSMRLVFKGGYGPAKLRYRFFGEDATDSFDTIVLDARLNNVWLHPDGGQRTKGQYTRDQYPSDIQNAMGGFAPYGRPVHLYLNGLYWGMYLTHERPDHRFAAAYLGGEPEDYDALKHNRSSVLNGSNQTYDEMFGISSSRYDLLQQYLDVPDFIDYMIMNFYVGNTDWSHKNWYATHNWRDPAGRWRYHSWDPEHCLKSLYEDVTGKNQSSSPTGLHQKWVANEEYRMLFADRVHKHFFNNGVLTPANAKALYQNILNQIDRAVVGESARWGDNRRSTPYTRDVEWVNQRNWLLNTYFPGRTDEVLTQFRDEKSPRWYPNVDAPEFNPHGGWDPSEITVTMNNPYGSGTIWYTIDGADPRRPGGAVNTPPAVPYTPGFEIDITETTQLKARVLSGVTWSALNEATYAIGSVAENLRITEIMYHPQDTNDPNDPNEEFIELVNTGPGAINLNLVRFTNGVDFTFPNVSLAEGVHILVLKDQNAFKAEYGGGFNVAGQYSGSLENGGERIELEDATGWPIHNFRYRDGWYDVTDGDGFSLTIRDANNTDPCDWGLKSSWGASADRGGSPGKADMEPKVGDIIINEILANSDTLPYDWVELYNPTDKTIDIGGWFLSDSYGGYEPNLMKYQIPENTTIGSDQYKVFTEAQFGDQNDPNCHVAFALSGNGETLYLSSGAPGELTLKGFRDERDFRASDPDVAFGLYTKSTLAALAGDPTDFVAMSQNTENSANIYPPIVGPIVIAEIMYHPEGSDDPELEYIKLVNITGSPVTLQRHYPNEGGIYVQWKFTDGIRYTFPADTTIGAYPDYIYVVYDKTEFESAYSGVPLGKIFGPFEDNDEGERTKLSNGGEDVELSKPGDKDETTGERFYILVDRVNYSDGTHPRDEYIDPWPTGPDGNGKSLKRKVLDEFGNDPNNWDEADPAPGE